MSATSATFRRVEVRRDRPKVGCDGDASPHRPGNDPPDHVPTTFRLGVAWHERPPEAGGFDATSSEEENLDEYRLYRNNRTANNSCRLPGWHRKMATYTNPQIE
jgi:hypothetical protein